VTRILHMRGDISGMFLFLVLLILGLWQLVVAWKGLNGFSLTGYQDRRKLSIVLGLAIITVASIWYFSRPGHFASPDLEGMETLILLALSIVVGTAIQAGLASLVYLLTSGRHKSQQEEVS
jgi:hypothetical protein